MFLTNWQISKISQTIKVLLLKAILTYGVLPIVAFLGRAYSTFVFVKPRFLVAFVSCSRALWFRIFNLFLNHKENIAIYKENIAVYTWNFVEAEETRVSNWRIAPK